MPADHGAGADGQSGQDGVEAQNGHQAAHQTCSSHGGGGHGTADGHEDGCHDKGHQNGGEAALGDHAADGGDGFVLAEDAAHGTAHSGDEQSADGDLEGAAHPVVHDDLEPGALLGQLAAGAVSIGFLDHLVLAAEDQAADSNDAHEQSQNGVAEGVEEVVGGRAFCREQLADGADGDHDSGQQQGQEGSAGAGGVVLLDEQGVYIVGVLHSLDALGVLGQGSNVLALGVDRAQAQVAHGKGDDGADQTDDDDGADVSAQQDGHCQDAGGGRHQTMGEGKAQVDKGGYLLHTQLLALGKDGGDGGVQDDGDVAENGDAHDKAGQGRGQLEALALELLDEEVDHAGGSAGVIDARCNDCTKNNHNTNGA